MRKDQLIGISMIQVSLVFFSLIFCSKMFSLKLCLSKGVPASKESNSKGRDVGTRIIDSCINTAASRAPLMIAILLVGAILTQIYRQYSVLEYRPENQTVLEPT